MMEKIVAISSLLLLMFLTSSCRQRAHTKQDDQSHAVPVETSAPVWTADNGDGTYRNPVLHADYSDPDVIRVNNDFYMTASSFNCVPGLPLLHSRDLVNWKLIGYALDYLEPRDHYSITRHGGGVWAPCLRYHNNEFYIYYPDPDFGIYMIKAKDISGPWSDPVLVKKGTGFIDPSPLWDDDGKAYLVYAFAGSRAGVKSVLIVSRMNAEGTVADEKGVMVFDGHPGNPTCEGPKFYKRNGYYYIFAPAGGVTNGWQMALRSRNIFGPYESKVVLHSGKSLTNGPHQGAWVDTQTGEDWFIHFQDKDAYGRIVHLEPMKWINDWPLPGIDEDGDGIGEPVDSYTKPDTGENYPPVNTAVSDEFNGSEAGAQWQWHSNPSVKWGYMSGNLGYFRLNCIPNPEGYKNLWDLPNLMLQKLPAEEFTATACLTFNARFDGEKCGLVIMGRSYQYISLLRKDDKMVVQVSGCTDADKGNEEEILQSAQTDSLKIYLRVKVEKNALCSFSYSTDGIIFREMGGIFRAVPGMWIGARIGFFALREGFINDSGNADIDWFRINKNE